MTTLRAVRNIAALFLFGMALLSLRPGVGVAHATTKKAAAIKRDPSLSLSMPVGIARRCAATTAAPRVVASLSKHRLRVGRSARSLTC